MNLPLFTGEYRRKPVQSLGGASKSDTKNDLLEKSRKQRLLREHRRQEEEAATRIQAFYRGSQSRRLTQNLTRQRFDELAAAAASVLDNSSGDAGVRDNFLLLAKCLNNFYLPHLDGDRIVHLCSLYVKHHRAISSFAAQRPPSSASSSVGLDLDSFALGKFLGNSLAHLSRLDQHADSRMYAGPLRVLELALQGGGGVSPALRQYLASKGYFRHLLAFIVTRCGLAGRSDLSDALSQPLTRSLCSLLLLPLTSSLANESGSDGPEQECRTLTGHLLRQTLCCPTACSYRGHRGCIGGSFFAVSQLPSPASPLVACQLVGPLLASAAASQPRLGSALLAAANDVTSPATGNGQSGPGLLHLLACQGREILLHSATMSPAASARLMLQLLHLSRPCLRELPADLAEDVAAGLSSDWFAEVARTAVADGPDSQVFVHLSSVIEMAPSLSLYSLTPAGPARSAFLRSFWQAISQFRHGQHPQPLVQLISRAVQPELPAMAALQPLLAAFARLFSPEPLTRQCLLGLSADLRDLLLGLLLLSHPDTRPDLLNADYVRALRSLGGAVGPEAAAGADNSGAGSGSRELLQLYSSLFSSVKLLVSRLYSLDQLRKFTPASSNASLESSGTSSHWSVQGRIPPIKSLQPAYWLEREASNSFGYYSVLNDSISIPYLSSTERLQLAILTEAPYLINFWDRVRLFYSLLHAYKASIDYDRHEFGASGIRVTARRDKIYEDAFSQLYGEENLYPRLKVSFRNELGLEEAGIDGGGLMREFLALVLSAAFDPQRGFYSQASSGALYPNPLSAAINSEFTSHYFFHGRLLGKLLFERLLIDLPLAPFFLRRVIIYASGARDAQQRAAASLDELEELDAELYKNVLALSSASAEDLEAMELDFSLTEDRLGRSETVELKPDGSSVRVTPDNVTEYQLLLADYRLRRQTAAQTQAFAQGLVSVIPCSDWLAFFSHNELQLLISGSDSPIDVLDLRRHTQYQNCSAESDTVAAFWRLMLDDFDELQRRAVLRFVTSLTRAPLYGWQELQPAFTLALVPETDRLPTASTCINLLKLPDYGDMDTLKQKLMLAVESNSGFELS
ncbi:hypothetical protein BOX15_Mlig022036g1 [Macrostomum lignano]|uniref:HECT-type E3 ubiquitin transferase n=1 Tax=Macrostomum lignano TaxID=282301 RepID=A0A267E5M5_9PLAT|nr:hypothetical protein BOX15_Mlig022036g1 [Macrostomum lignano]